ncbi:hypothetical protein ABPG74_010376 [Tetrahymena malaccensis]
METTFKPGFLKGKIVLITGGATGICYGIALGFLKYGARVCIMSRKLPNIQAAIESLKKESGSSEIYGTTCDVRKLEDIEKAVDYFIEKVGKIDVLINGAAGNFLVPFENMSANAFKTVIEIDLQGTFLVTKVVHAKCLKGRGGSIINISSTLQVCGVALQTHAGAAKAAIDAITRHLAVELGSQGIRVNGIAPGAIDGTAGFEKLTPEGGLSISMKETIPLNRLGKKSDIAECAMFLASDAASYISGQTLIVDGGAVLTFPNFTLLSPQVRKLLNPSL